MDVARHVYIHFKQLFMLFENSFIVSLKPSFLNNVSWSYELRKTFTFVENVSLTVVGLLAFQGRADKNECLAERTN